MIPDTHEPSLAEALEHLAAKVNRFNNLKLWLVGFILGVAAITAWLVRVENKIAAANSEQIRLETAVTSNTGTIYDSRLEQSGIKKDVELIKTVQQEMKIDLKELLREVKKP